MRKMARVWAGCEPAPQWQGRTRIAGQVQKNDADRAETASSL
jgi:hypothetical protein